MSKLATEAKMVDAKIKKVLYQNFILYFILTAFFLYYYSSQLPYDRYSQSRIATLSFLVYVLAPFFKLAFDKYRAKFSMDILTYSFLINLIFVSLSSTEIFLVYIRGQNYWYYGVNGALAAWYILVGLIIVTYVSRHKLKSFFDKLYHQSLNATKFTIKSVKKYGFRATLIPFVLEWWSIRHLSTDYRAVYFAKKFIILQSKPIKATLPGLLPDTISASMKDIFQNDIDRMQQLFKYNHIKTYSKVTSLKFVMRIADPIIKDLQLTLEQHLTEELLKESNTSKNLQINVDNLWKKVEKIVANWESTFSDSELEFKDSILIK